MNRRVFHSACSKMDTKKHKQVCSKLVLCLRKPSLGDGMSTQEVSLYTKHLMYLVSVGKGYKRVFWSLISSFPRARVVVVLVVRMACC